MEQLSHFLFALVFNFGLMAVCSLAFGTARREIHNRVMKHLAYGLTFGLGAISSMMMPIQFLDGFNFDGRTLFLGVAAAAGGWPAALISVGMAGSVRFSLGGAGMPIGIAVICVASFAGLYVGYIMQKRMFSAALWPNMLVGLAVSITVLPIPMLNLPISIAAEFILMANIAALNILGAVLFFRLLRREVGLIETEKRLQTAASIDHLTSLPNRAVFDTDLDVAFANKKATLLMIDVDNFKKINDIYGHAAGDEALRAIAATLKTTVSHAGRSYRIGGEEFAIILDANDMSTSHIFASKIRKSIEDIWVRYHGLSFPLTVSIGVTQIYGAKTTIHAFEQADAALYKAKSSGKNMVVVSA